MSGSQSTTDLESQIARLEENALAEEEIRCKAHELEAKEKAHIQIQPEFLYQKAFESQFYS